VPDLTPTPVVVTVDAVRRLTAIAADVLCGAPPSMVLGDPYGGGCP
jgi:hypothetical protein